MFLFITNLSISSQKALGEGLLPGGPCAPGLPRSRRNAVRTSRRKYSRARPVAAERGYTVCRIHQIRGFGGASSQDTPVSLYVSKSSLHGVFFSSRFSQRRKAWSNSVTWAPVRCEMGRNVGGTARPQTRGVLAASVCLSRCPMQGLASAHDPPSPPTCLRRTQPVLSHPL